MAFKLAKVLGNSHATHEWPGTYKFYVADHSQLCYPICTMKAPPQALPKGLRRSLHSMYHFMAFTEASSPGPGEEASWYSCLVLCAIQYAL